MKKKHGWIVLILTAIAALFAGSVFSGCKTTGQETEGPTETRSMDDYVDYYGCPNSRRVRKLNLKKRNRA